MPQASGVGVQPNSKKLLLACVSFGKNWSRRRRRNVVRMPTCASIAGDRLADRLAPGDVDAVERHREAVAVARLREQRARLRRVVRQALLELGGRAVDARATGSAPVGVAWPRSTFATIESTLIAW